MERTARKEMQEHEDKEDVCVGLAQDCTASSPPQVIAVVQEHQSERKMAQDKNKVQKLLGLAKTKSKNTESLCHKRQGFTHMA